MVRVRYVLALLNQHLWQINASGLCEDFDFRLA